MITAIHVCACLFIVALAFLAIAIGFYWYAQAFSVWTEIGASENDDDDDGDQNEEKPPHLRGPDYWKKGRW